MPALNVKIAVNRRGQNEPDSVPVTEASRAEFRDAISLSAFGDVEDARQFIKNNREKLAELGFSEDTQIRELKKDETGEVLGAYIRRRAPMTANDAENALDSLTS